MSENRDRARTWTEAECAWTPWGDGARRGSVLIDTDAGGALVTVVDDAGAPRFYRVAPDRVPAFLAAALQAWPQVDTGEAVAVVWRNRPTTKGRVPGPPPPPLTSDDALRASAWVAYLALAGSLELAGQRARAAHCD